MNPLASGTRDVAALGRILRDGGEKKEEGVLEVLEGIFNLSEWRRGAGGARRRGSAPADDDSWV